MVARVFLISILIAVPLMAADDFYEQQLRAGKVDFQAGRLPQAADELRIAAFGLLQQPPLLSDALARLAVVQNTLGQTAELSRTIDRFIDVEQRFSPYANVQLEPAIKSKFEELVVHQVPRPTLKTLPALARLVNYEFLKIADMPPAQRVAAYEAGVQREPKNPDWVLALTREAAARDASNDVIKWGMKVLELDPSNKDERPAIAHARASRRECKEALAIIKDLDLQQRPDLYADQAFCFAELSHWKEAQTVLASVPDKLKGRADVKRTVQLVAQENDRVAKAAERAKAEQARAEQAKAQQAKAEEAARIAKANTPTKPRSTVPQASSAPLPTKPADIIDSSRKLVRDGKYSEAMHQLRPAVQSEPQNRSLRLSLLEAAVLARDWRTAASQVPMVTPLTPGEELYMFYASVALYETGRHDEAKLFMEKARPRMVPSPMVDYYVKAVLGQQRGS